MEVTMTPYMYQTNRVRMRSEPCDANLRLACFKLAYFSPPFRNFVLRTYELAGSESSVFIIIILRPSYPLNQHAALLVVPANRRRLSAQHSQRGVHRDSGHRWMRRLRGE